MANYRARGIVIRRDNFGEADRRVTLLTDRFGKMVVLAKGSRRAKSKLASATNLLTELDFTAAESRSLDILTEAHITKSHHRLADHLLRIKYAYWLTELTDKIMHEREAQLGSYELLGQMLAALEERVTLLVVDFFIYHLLTDLGYRPELSKCVNCGSILRADDNLAFSPQAGGVIDSRCHMEDARPVSAAAIKAMRYLVLPWDKVIKLRLT